MLFGWKNSLKLFWGCLNLIYHNKINKSTFKSDLSAPYLMYLLMLPQYQNSFFRVYNQSKTSAALDNQLLFS